MTATDATTVPDVDLTRDVPCEWSSGTCGKPAAWMSTTACCRIHTPACNGCHDEAIRLARDLGAFRFRCSRCGHVTTAPDWHEWRPL